MNEDGCGSSVVWNICSEISLDNVFLKFINWITFKWDSVMWHIIPLMGVYLSLDHIEDS